MKLKITFLIGLLMSLTFVGCSSDNDPEAELTGQEEYNLLLGTITTSDGEIAYSPISEDPSQRAKIAYSEADSRIFCEALLLESWNGDNITRTLADGYGNFSISKSDEEGVFNIVNFNIKGYEPFSLKIATEEYLDNSNAAIAPGSYKATYYWRCRECGYMINESRGKPNPCPKCNNSDPNKWTKVCDRSPLT